jgi:sugar O-acyltransferase (sialic acid O-acetyltransferase NeuD family)
MKKIIIIGGGDFAKKIIRLIGRIGDYEIIGYTDIEDRGTLFGVDYLGNDENVPNLFEKYNCANVAIGIGGNISLADAKRRIISRLVENNINFPSLISPNAFIEEDVIIGEGVVVFDNVFVDYGVRIGDFSVLNLNVTICHNTIISENVIFSPNSLATGGSEIGKNSFIGSNVTINPYIKIGSECIIGTGSVAIKDCLKSGTYVGIPAHEL